MVLLHVVVGSVRRQYDRMLIKENIVKTAAFLAFLLIATPLAAGEIVGFIEPSQVNSIVMRAMSEWSLDPTNVAGCGAADCCPDTSLDAACVAAGDPWACCTGAAAGTCNDDACEQFATNKIIPNPAGWAGLVAAQLPLDGDWLCTSWPKSEGSNERQTACTTISGTPLIDVSRILSEFAAQVEAP